MPTTTEILIAIAIVAENQDRPEIVEIGFLRRNIVLELFILLGNITEPEIVNNLVIACIVAVVTVGEVEKIGEAVPEHNFEGFSVESIM